MNAARNILAAGHAVMACGERAQSGPLDEAGTLRVGDGVSHLPAGISSLQAGEDVKSGSERAPSSGAAPGKEHRG